jgi:hypothetical protein
MEQKINEKDQVAIGTKVLEAMKLVLSEKQDDVSLHDRLKAGTINPINFYLGCMRAAMAFTGNHDPFAFLADLQRGLSATEVDSAVEAYYQQQKANLEKKVSEKMADEFIENRKEERTNKVIPLSERFPVDDVQPD